MKTEPMDLSRRRPSSENVTAAPRPEGVVRGPQGAWKCSSHIRRQLLLLAALGPLYGFGAAASTIVSPGADTSVEGSSNNGYPFNIAAFSYASMRYQQVFNSAEFTAAGGPMLITAIAFRPDTDTGVAFSSTLSSVQIDLSTTSVSASTLGAVFASNVGANDTVVFNGALSLSSAYTGPAAGPKNFDIVITLTTPFVYNSANGNLLLDVRNFGGGATTQFDSDALPPTQRVWSGAVSATTGTNVGDTGLVTQFIFTAVPEPQVACLAVLGVAAMAARRLRQTGR